MQHESPWMRHTVAGEFWYRGPGRCRFYYQFPAFDYPHPTSCEQSAVAFCAVAAQEKGPIVNYPRGTDSRSECHKRGFSGLGDVPSATVDSKGRESVSRTTALPQSMEASWTLVRWDKHAGHSSLTRTQSGKMRKDPDVRKHQRLHGSYLVVVQIITNVTHVRKDDWWAR